MFSLRGETQASKILKIISSGSQKPQQLWAIGTWQRDETHFCRRFQVDILPWSYQQTHLWLQYQQGCDGPNSRLMCQIDTDRISTHPPEKAAGTRFICRWPVCIWLQSVKLGIFQCPGPGPASLTQYSVLVLGLLLISLELRGFHVLVLY